MGFPLVDVFANGIVEVCSGNFSFALILLYHTLLLIVYEQVAQ